MVPMVVMYRKIAMNPRFQKTSKKPSALPIVDPRLKKVKP